MTRKLEIDPALAFRGRFPWSDARVIHDQPMNSKSSLFILGYAMVLLVSGVAAHFVSPELAQVSFFTGLVGGIVCGALGFLSLLGRRTRAWTILTLVGLSFTLLSQAVLSWAAVAGAGAAPGAVAVLITVMFVLSISLLMFLAYTAPAQSAA